MDSFKKKAEYSTPDQPQYSKQKIWLDQRDNFILVRQKHMHIHTIHCQVTYTEKCKTVLAHVETEQVQYAYEIPFRFNQFNF